LNYNGAVAALILRRVSSLPLDVPFRRGAPQFFEACDRVDASSVSHVDASASHAGARGLHNRFTGPRKTLHVANQMTRRRDVPT
jgi:hypothetical protein